MPTFARRRRPEMIRDPYEDSEQEEYLPHTDGRPFCNESDCPCHEDQEAINTLNDQYNNGLVTAEERDNIYQGGTI
jgi:hypothetical protein